MIKITTHVYEKKVPSVEDLWKGRVFDTIIKEGAAMKVVNEELRGLIPFEAPTDTYNLPHVTIKPYMGTPVKIVVVGHMLEYGNVTHEEFGYPLYKEALEELRTIESQGHFKIAYVEKQLIGRKYKEAQEVAATVTNALFQNNASVIVLVALSFVDASYLRSLVVNLPQWARIVLWAREQPNQAFITGQGINAQALASMPQARPFLLINGDLEGWNLQLLKSYIKAAQAHFYKQKTVVVRFGGPIAGMMTDISSAETFGRHGWIFLYRDHGLVREVAQFIVQEWHKKHRGKEFHKVANILDDAIVEFKKRSWKTEANIEEGLTRSLALTLVLSAASKVDEADAIAYQCAFGTMGWCSGCMACGLLGQVLPFACEAEERTCEGTVEEFLLGGVPGQLADIRYYRMIDPEKLLGLSWWINCGSMRLSLCDTHKEVIWRPQNTMQGDVGNMGFCTRFQAMHKDPEKRELTITRPLEIAPDKVAWLVQTAELVNKKLLEQRLNQLGSDVDVDKVWKELKEIHPPDNWGFMTALMCHLDEPYILTPDPSRELEKFIKQQWGGGYNPALTASTLIGNHAAIIDKNILPELQYELSMGQTPTPLAITAATQKTIEWFPALRKYVPAFRA